MSPRDTELAISPTVFLALSDPGVVPPPVYQGLADAGLTLDTCASGGGLMEAFDPGVPSCTLLDLALPPSGGLDILAKLRRRRWTAPILAIGRVPSTRVAVEAMRLGANDVLEPSPDPYLLQTRILQLVEQDRQAIAAERACADRQRRLDTLSRRERQVLGLVLKGLSNKETARVLEVSPKAIEIYRAGMMRKLGQRSSIAMARWVSSCPRCTTNPQAGADGDCLQPVITPQTQAEQRII